MAQILKFAAGGKTYSNTLTVNGETFSVTDDLIKSFYKHGESAANEGIKYQYYKIADALKSGKTLELSGKSLIGDVDFDTSDYGESRMKKGVKWALGREQDAREAIDHALKFTYNIPPEPEPEKTKYDWSKKLTATYDVKTTGKGRNKKTTKTWIDSLDNNEFLKRLDAWKSIATGTNNNIELVGLDGITAQQLRDHYNTLGPEKFNELYTRIKEGTADKADHEILKAYNLFLFDEPSNLQKSSSASKSTGAITGGGGYTGGTYPKATTYGVQTGQTSANLFTINPTTKQITFNDPGLLAYLQTTPNVWLNESFVSANPQYAELLKYYPKGVMIFQDGSIYDAQDIESLNQHPIFQQFVLRNKETAGSSNEVIKQWWNGEQDEVFKKIGENYDALGLNGLQGKYIRDIGWKYGQLPAINLDNGTTFNPTHLIELYPDNLTDNMFDQYGFILPQHIQKRAYNLSGDNLFALDLLNDSNFLKQLTTAPQISNVAQQENKKNNPFIVTSKNINGKNIDVLADEKNFKIYRTESNYLKIAIKQNGKWHWFTVHNKDVATALNTNPNSLTKDKFNEWYSSGYIQNDLSNNEIKNALIPKGERGMKIPDIVNDWISKIDLTRTLQGSNSTNNYFPDITNDLISKIDLDRIYQDSKTRNNYLSYPDLKEPIVWTNEYILKKAQNDIAYDTAIKKNESKLNPKISEIITTNFSKDHPNYSADKLYGGKEKNNFKFRPDDAWALADLVTSFIGNKKTIDKQKEAIRNAVTYKNAPVLQRPIFSDNGLMHQKQAAINRITNTPIRYSDAALNSSEHLNKLSLAENIHANTNAQLSDLYSKYKLQLLDIANKESALNTETDYENRKMYNTARAAMSQYDASRIAANGESIKKFIYEQREKTKQDLANLQQIALASKQGEFDAAMKAEFEKRGGWSLIKDEELKNMLMENANYQMTMRHVDPAYVSNEYNRFFKDVKLDPTYRQGIIPYWMYGKRYTNYNKKGGKINNVFHDAFLEDVKATNKALESLHKDIRKLLLKLTK